MMKRGGNSNAPMSKATHSNKTGRYQRAIPAEPGATFKPGATFTGPSPVYETPGPAPVPVGMGTTTATLPRKPNSAMMKKGGSVSSASKRADGIATKGKTKGRMV